jgi:formate-dependent phosphoribosylglycinamide formyltransferase (GAR transformylase)
VAGERQAGLRLASSRAIQKRRTSQFRFPASDVVEVLEKVCAQIGYPGSIRVDEGSDFISRELD